MSTAIASLTDCSRSLDSGDALDPPVSKCLGNNKWTQKLQEVFVDDLFTVSDLKNYTYDEFILLLKEKKVATELCKPIANAIRARRGDVFKEGT